LPIRFGAMTECLPFLRRIDKRNWDPNLTCRLARISTLIVSPSTIPVTRPWRATCSRPKVYVAGLGALGQERHEHRKRTSQGD
jgi:hypothetical protein